jgi:hypothetical protein
VRDITIDRIINILNVALAISILVFFGFSGFGFIFFYEGGLLVIFLAILISLLICIALRITFGLIKKRFEKRETLTFASHKSINNSEI